MSPPSLVASYRLQLGPGVDFDAATKIVPRLAALGISHVYASPILEAGRGSTHGYDVVDHAAVREELGGRAGLERLVAALRAHGLGLIVDIVPNHMSIADVRNRWWWDVLENGRTAHAAMAFDVDWDSPEEALKNVVLVPILGDHRAKVLERGEVAVRREGARFLVRYHEHRLPVAPRPTGELLSAASRIVPSDRLAFLADAYSELPLPTALDRASIERRHRDRVVLGALLAELLDADATVGPAIDRSLATLNADPDALDAFLDRQNYRLAYWRSADRNVDYRRFFDITSLVGLHTEDELVFHATHDFIGELCRAGLIDGLRVDHVDGLADPVQYLARLRALVGPRPIFVEKILAVDERLRDWPVQGTTGYEFGADVCALFVDPAGEAPLGELLAALTGETRSFEEVATEARRRVLRESLDSEVQRLTHLAASLRERHRDARDFTRHDLHAAIAALCASFPTYRSYVAPARDEVAHADRVVIESAVAAARRLVPDVEPPVFDFLADVLLLRRRGDAETELVERFQQLTPPAMAKGVEDTAFYRYPKLLALDEVGNNPQRFSLAAAEFHARCRDAAARWPERMLTTSTHDTKRSEDARARLVVLAEDHAAFAELARRFFSRVDGNRGYPVPEALTILCALQSLVAAWPIDLSRFAAFLKKAVREAKRETSWTRPDAEYERKLDAFAEGVLRDGEATSAVASYVARIDQTARDVSLGWTLLKATCPGFPDFYQGNERWRHDLVDPDNRRPLDWSDASESPKSALIRRALDHRRAHAACFAPGSSYEPLDVPADAQVLAFTRSAPGAGATLTVVALRVMARPDRAGDLRVRLPRGRFSDVLGGGGAIMEGELPLRVLLGDRPFALHHAEDAS